MKGKQNKQTNAQKYAKREKRGTIGPAQTLGSVSGTLAGSMLGPAGAAAGFALGGALGKYAGYYTGTGDYRYSGIGPMQNAVFKNTGHVVTHREYITDVISGTGSGSTGFDISSYPLNPGVSKTFPWMATIAANYEEYEILGMVFTYVSTSGESVASTSTSLGAVILATEYDPTKPAFQNKQAMENYEFATSCKPSVGQVHAIECNRNKSSLKQRYVRSGVATGTDLRWSDFGNFYIATVGCPQPGVTLGELWVTYKVKLLKPRLPVTVGLGGQIASGAVNRSGVTTAVPVGTTQLFTKGSIPVTCSGTGIEWPSLPNMNYLVFVNITASTTSIVTRTAGFGSSPYNLFNAGTTSFLSTTNTSSAFAVFAETCTNQDTDGVSKITIACTVGTGGFIDVIVTQVDETLA